MVAPGIESGRERKYLGRTKLHTEATGLAALDDDGNTSFCHWISTLGAAEHSPKSKLIILGEGAVGRDRNHRYR
jgi:hypothetical protein